jgi:hypothetical protein
MGEGVSGRVFLIQKLFHVERCYLLHAGQYVAFYCPGCGYEHHVPISPLTGYTVLWEFNGDLERPTITPSILRYAAGSEPRCHLVITDGVIHYGSDCDHALASQAVDMPPMGP